MTGADEEKELPTLTGERQVGGTPQKGATATANVKFEAVKDNGMVNSEKSEAKVQQDQHSRFSRVRE